MMKSKGVALCVVCAISAAACARPCSDVTFAGLREADRVVVAVNMNPVTPPITDPATISKLVAFAVSHEQGWEMPVPDTPIPPVKLDFYSGQRFLGHLGIGTHFLETQGCDYFVSKSVSAGDRQLLMAMLHLPEGS